MSSKYLKSLTESQALSLRLVMRVGTVEQTGLLLNLLAINISKLNAKIYVFIIYDGIEFFLISM